MAETGSGGFDVSKLGGMMGGQGGGKSNFMDAVVQAEKDAWSKYINSTNLQQQAVLPTHPQPTVQSQAPKQQVKSSAQPAVGEQKPIVVVQPQQQEQPTVDPAFADYKKTAIDADELKKKNMAKTEAASIDTKTTL